jgi:SAM-dependent methyltransferase
MYEQTGRYYALFGPKAAVTSEERQFFAHWATGRQRALDIGAGLCGPAMMLAELGLEVLAFEPSPILATLAMDRLSRDEHAAHSITLVEGQVDEFAEPFAADLILMRSVLMLLDDDERAVALEAAQRHAAPEACLIVDVRTAALPWVENGGATEERRLGQTVYRRHTQYAREANGATRVSWKVEAERFGRTTALAAESFNVRADDLGALTGLLRQHGFEIEKSYASYDLERPYASGEAMIVAVARKR